MDDLVSQVSKGIEGRPNKVKESHLPNSEHGKQSTCNITFVLVPYVVHVVPEVALSDSFLTIDDFYSECSPAHF